MRRALVVGGTGPTGPHIVEGLLARGFGVTVFHRGTHETPDLPPVEHIHGDPHFAPTIAEALGNRSFDVIVATYGRIGLLAQAAAGRCAQFIGIGGVAAYRGSMDDQPGRPSGMPIAATEDAPTHDFVDPDASPAAAFGARVRAVELAVMELHRSGAFSATWFRYPAIYGPRQVAPSEWSVVRRVLDRRPFMILPDGGLVTYSRCAARNAAHAVLLAVDQPESAAGRTYNCADRELFSLRQWVESICAVMGSAMEIVSLPFELATAAHGLARAPAHVVVDTSRIRAELGYREVVSTQEALREAVDWYLEHPVREEDYPWLTDRFDYAAEDRLVSAFRLAVSDLRPLAAESPPFVHPYAHPDAPALTRDRRGR